ncbi:MAG: FkbM family methyltransferase [Rhodospirillaceae bacterium]
MGLRKKIRQFAFRHGTIIERAAPEAAVCDFIKRFRENFVSADLIRIGGDHDGGYLVPKILDQVQYCFSPGVDVTADFEKQLSRDYQIRSFMADASVDAPPLVDENFTFSKKFLGLKSSGNYVTLSDWVSQSVGKNAVNMVLQMDIEGGEYDVLIYESSEFLSKFSIMIIEFHDLQNLFERNFLNSITAIFEKIYCHFAVCHVHANNCCGLAQMNGIDVPRVIEVTFVRRDLVELCSLPDTVCLPHHLDQRNVVNIDDLLMPDLWWKKT